MTYSYNRKITKTEMRKLAKIATALQCGFDDIVEITADEMEVAK